MAIGLQQGLRELGIPAEWMPAIVGYDDSDAAELTTPALSSVRVPFYQLGEIAAAKVLELPESGSRDTEQETIHVKLPAKLIVRASSLRLGGIQ
ncbi:substrate-binding domain-containing protein, partial [Paenibacillus riograndensis]